MGFGIKYFIYFFINKERKQAIIGLGHVILFVALVVGNLEFYVIFPVKERRAAVIAAETAVVLMA